MIDYSKIDELFAEVIESGDLVRLQELVELEGGPEYIDTPHSPVL